jgi:hypothetical protein
LLNRNFPMHLARFFLKFLRHRALATIFQVHVDLRPHGRQFLVYLRQ